MLDARDALRRGEAQAAANSISRATAAQQHLDGGSGVRLGAPADADTPHRDIIASSSDLDEAKRAIVAINRTREQSGAPLLNVDISRQQADVADDPALVWERVTIRLSGASTAELDAIQLKGVRSTPEKRARTEDVLAVACAAARRAGGYRTRDEGGEMSTPARVNKYLSDPPESMVRQELEPTPEDRARADAVRQWVQSTPPANDYMRAVRHAVAENSMSMRDVGTAASALAGFERHEARREVAHDRAGQMPSRWLNKPGDNVMLVARVEQVVPMMHESRTQPAYLYVMRTPDGDLVRWVAQSNAGLRERDEITLRGTVKGHSVFNGERQTEMFYCQPPQVHPQSA